MPIDRHPTVRTVVVIRVLAVIAGVVFSAWVLLSAVKTVVVPRAVISRLTRLHFLVMRRIFDVLSRASRDDRDWERHDRVMALYAPLSLVILPGVWVALVMVGFTFIFWGIGIDPWTEALVISGSSLVTLGFERPQGTPGQVVAVAEAAIGLGIVSLMISYLPTIYGAFSRREALVGMLEVRAGLPPSAAELFTRYERIGWLDRIDEDVFERWEQWFIDVEESHTSQPSLVFFRSPPPGRSWLTAAGCVLDVAALADSTLATPYDARGPVMMRTGFFCLRRIADMFAIAYDPNPAPDAPISITRADFDELCARLDAQGIALKDDRDQAWRDFAGWRVNYDAVLLGLCSLVQTPPGIWSTDRMPPLTRRPPLRRPTR
jgi:hypothetical protein